MLKRTLFLLSFFVGLASVQAQTYKPVGEKSAIKFSIKNFGIATGGDFKGLEGNIEFDPANPSKIAFDVSVDANTVNTDNDSRDGHLRKEEYFDVAKHPKITFKSEKVAGKGSGFTVTGQLSIKGVTKTVSFPFTAVARDEGVHFEGNFKINRRDFNVGGNSMVLGDEVTVTLSVFAKKGL